MLLRRRGGKNTTTTTTTTTTAAAAAAAAGGGEWENMLVGKISEMALFRQQLRHRPDDGVAVAVIVSFGGGGKKGWEGRKKEVKLEVALEPDTQGLELIDVVLHGSGTKAYRMGERYDRWFSECFGYEVGLLCFPPFFMLFFPFSLLSHFMPAQEKKLCEPYPNYAGIGDTCLPGTASTSGAGECGSREQVCEEDG